MDNTEKVFLGNAKGLRSRWGIRHDPLVKRPKRKRRINFSFDKRQKFIIGTIFLTLILFFSESVFGKSGIFIALPLAIFNILFLWWATYRDIRENKSYEVFLLPFFYSISFGLFYFLTPTAFVSRLILTGVYAFGLYSLFLSQNILTISSIKTITLLSGARIVSFVAALVSYFFLTNIVYSLHANIFIPVVMIAIYSYALIHHSLWTYNLQKTAQFIRLWVFGLTICLVEAGAMLWFWPSSPTVIALFLTGFFYSVVGLSHIWFERRLFKGIMWEYVWVGCIVFFVLILFTPFGK